MPGNLIQVNDCPDLRWYVGDSAMDRVFALLDDLGHRDPAPEKKAAPVIRVLLDKRDTGSPIITVDHDGRVMSTYRIDHFPNLDGIILYDTHPPVVPPYVEAGIDEHGNVIPDRPFKVGPHGWELPD